MKNKTLFLLFIVTICCIGHLLAQDSDRVVILSPRIGPEIDQQERTTFHLFPKIEHFLQAVVYITPKESFIIRVKTLSGGIERDTILQYSENILLLISEKIDHMEEIIEGKYIMGSNPTSIALLDGKKILMSHTPDYNFSWQAKKYQSDRLPFYGKPDNFDETWTFSIGVGITNYNPNFKELKNAFLVIANQYKSRDIPGDPVLVPREPELPFSPLIWYHLSFNLFSGLALIGETSTKKSDDEIFTALSASLLYYPPIFNTRVYHPFVGLGYGFYHFSIETKYSIPIDSVYRNTYDSLSGFVNIFDKITSSGGNNGIILSGGCDIDLFPHVQFQAIANYLIVPEMITTISPNTSVKVFLGSFMVGGRLQLVL